MRRSTLCDTRDRKCMDKDKATVNAVFEICNYLKAQHFKSATFCGKINSFHHSHSNHFSGELFINSHKHSKSA